MLLKILLLCSLTFMTAAAAIKNTKHNLSTSGPGTTKAQTEDQICAFCHIPHSAQQGAPLWNREMPASNYTMYDSTYLRRTGYPIPTDLGSTTGAPGAKSRVCLSCHDGTVAVGAVYILRGTILGETIISMSGVEGIGTIPAGATNFGTDLSNHHPVGYKYDSTVVSPDQFDIGDPVTTELIATPTAPIKLHTYGTDNYVECTSCHDPHTENAKFLRVSSGASHGENVLNTCLACHDKGRGVPWGGGAHEGALMTYKKAWGSSVPDKYKGGVDVSVSEIWCINCHTPHNGEGKPTLLRKVEQNTCYRGAEDDSVVNPAAQPCHQDGQGGGAVRRSIEPVANRAYGHPIHDTDGVHTGLDTLYGVDNVDAGKGVDWGTSRHAECMDCHNPHMAGPGMHVPDNQWYPNTPTNDVSDVLRNVSGVKPTWPSVWQQPTTFTTMRDSEKEYQICMKCHSYWGLGSATFGVSSETLSNINYTAGQDIVTDQAWEFNPKNRAAHPVVMSANDMLLEPGTARYAHGLEAIELKAPWNANAGNNVMYCSDCHGADDEDTVDAKGPHGSSKKYMLKGESKYWPEDPATGDAWFILDALDDSGNALASPKEIFCLNCHNIEKDVGNNAHRVKAQNSGDAFLFGGIHIQCVNCHVAVPHGSPVSRLMGYYNFPEPYNYNGDSLQLTGFKYDDSNPGQWSDAYLVDHNGSNPNYPAIDTTPSCGPNGSGFCHSGNAGGYDPWMSIP